MRIALISDIHYGAMSTTSELAIQGEPLHCGEVSNASPLFQGLIDVLKKEKPDYLFIAGDLTSTGNPLEFKNCYEKIYLLANNIKVLPSNVILCLGNHDIDWRITQLIESYKTTKNTAYLTEDINFLEMNYLELANSWAVNKNTKLPSDSVCLNNQCNKIPFTGIVERNDCIIYVLNSGHLCSHDESKKHGCLSKQQLQWFKDLVQEKSSSPKVKIVLLHHHPFNYPFPLPGRDISTLEEGGELYQICGEYGIDLVLHGHRHHPKAKTILENGWSKPVTYICAGSLSVNATHRLQGSIPNTFHIIEYHTREKIILKNYEYSFTNGWVTTKDSRAEVPLEGSMLLGKIIDANDPAIINLIKELPINKNIEFDSLNNDLSYLNRHKIIKLAEQEFINCTIYSESDYFLIFNPSGVVL
jgi:3',5'-cyclic AMP phosphodiesterase CpdA